MQQNSSLKPLTFYRHCGKRVLDLVLIMLALPVLPPAMALVALLVRLKLGSPVFFRQQRPGLQGKPFTIYKFRTMTDARDARGNLLPDTQRLTPCGRWLRSTSLDELPELINVLKGEMSLVGPRPLLMKYLPYYTEKERKRFEVLPGITGLAQVNGRNHLPWDERLAYDVWYVEHRSPKLDLTIIFRTLLQVWRGHDVQVDPGSTMLDLDKERGKSAF